MPVGKPTTAREVRAIAIALGGIAIAVAIGYGMLRVAADGKVRIRLGDDRFDAGQIERQARTIAEDGPITYPPLVGDRVLIVNHLGDDPTTGWLAFSARPPGAHPECIVGWQPDEGVFVDPCTDESYPADGEGLEPYPTIVLDGRVIVDLNRIEERRAADEADGSGSDDDGVVRSGEPRTTDSGS